MDSTPSSPTVHQNRRGEDGFDIAPMDSCPACGDVDIDVASANGDLCFRCRTCAAHWRYELGHVRLPADTSTPPQGCTFPA